MGLQFQNVTENTKKVQRGTIKFRTHILKAYAKGEIILYHRRNGKKVFIEGCRIYRSVGPHKAELQDYKKESDL